MKLLSLLIPVLVASWPPRNHLKSPWPHISLLAASWPPGSHLEDTINPENHQKRSYTQHRPGGLNKYLVADLRALILTKTNQEDRPNKQSWETLFAGLVDVVRKARTNRSLSVDESKIMKALIRIRHG